MTEDRTTLADEDITTIAAEKQPAGFAVTDAGDDDSDSSDSDSSDSDSSDSDSSDTGTDTDTTDA